MAPEVATVTKTQEIMVHQYVLRRSMLEIAYPINFSKTTIGDILNK